MPEINIPVLVIVFGLPGSGKSYFAERLAKRINAEYISSDSIRNQMFRYKTYSEDEKQLVYQNMLAQMEFCLKEKKNVVLDATFHKKERRKYFSEKAGENAKVFFMEIIAGHAVIAKRLERKRPDSDADMEVYEKIKSRWEPLQSPHLILQSTDGNMDEMLEKALEYLKLTHDN